MRRVLIKAVVTMSIAFLTSAQGQAQASANSRVRRAIESANNSFRAAFNRGDASAVAAMYSSGARVLPPNGQIIEGSQNIQTFWQGLVTMGAKLVKLETLQVDSRGDMAYELGKYTLTIPQAGGQTITDEGKYLVVWKKQGRGWKLFLDMWNTSMPAQGP